MRLADRSDPFPRFSRGELEAIVEEARWPDDVFGAIYTDEAIAAASRTVCIRSNIANLSTAAKTGRDRRREKARCGADDGDYDKLASEGVSLGSARVDCQGAENVRAAGME